MLLFVSRHPVDPISPSIVWWKYRNFNLWSGYQREISHFEPPVHTLPRSRDCRNASSKPQRTAKCEEGRQFPNCNSHDEDLVGEESSGKKQEVIKFAEAWWTVKTTEVLAKKKPTPILHRFSHKTLKACAVYVLLLTLTFGESHRF
jgi:hypothetical protein